MRQWFAEHLLTNGVRITGSPPISDKEFHLSLAMVSAALTLFGILINFLGR